MAPYGSDPLAIVCDIEECVIAIGAALAMGERVGAERGAGRGRSFGGGLVDRLRLTKAAGSASAGSV